MPTTALMRGRKMLYETGSFLVANMTIQKIRVVVLKKSWAKNTIRGISMLPTQSLSTTWPQVHSHLVCKA